MQIKKIYSDLSKPMAIVVFASGTGTNFDHIYSIQKKLESEKTKNYAKIRMVFTNNPNRQLEDLFSNSLFF